MRPVHLLVLLVALVPLADSRLSHRSHPHIHHTLPRPAASIPRPTGSPLADLCAISEYPDVCLNTATPLVSGLPHLDFMSLLNVLVATATTKTQAATATLNQLVADPRTPPLVAKNLKDCQESFTDTLDDLQVSKDAIAKGDSGTALTRLSAGISDLETCNDVFSDLPTVQPNPMADQILLLEHTVAVCLSFVYKAFNVPELPS